MISKTMKTILHALSAGNIEVENSRRLADLKQLDATRIFLKKMDTKVYNGEHVVPIRLYFPTENAMSAGIEEGSTFPVLLFFHGGGWVTESVENYDRVCSRMAQATAHIVVSVEYRLAPEHRFPVPLEDCYAATRALYTNQLIINTDPEELTIVGDSAGGNLAAAVCLLARDRGEFMPRRQILIYPALGNCYTEKSPFRSVQENGSDYLLTAVKMEDYLNLYQSSPSDRNNPYFAPIVEENLKNLPETLILTAEYDPLRDEGEAYGKKLREAGNQVEIHRISGAFHGFFALGFKFLHVQESFGYINQFLNASYEKILHLSINDEKIK